MRERAGTPTRARWHAIQASPTRAAPPIGPRTVTNSRSMGIWQVSALSLSDIHPWTLRPRFDPCRASTACHSRSAVGSGAAKSAQKQAQEPPGGYLAGNGAEWSRRQGTATASRQAHAAGTEAPAQPERRPDHAPPGMRDRQAPVSRGGRERVDEPGSASDPGPHGYRAVSRLGRRTLSATACRPRSGSSGWAHRDPSSRCTRGFART